MLNIKHERLYDIHLINQKICAYIITHIHDNIAKKYVGSTENLSNRIYYGHHDKKLIYIDIFETDNIHFARSLEKILMNLIKPASNKKYQSLSDKEIDLNNDLLKNVLIKEHILENTIKVGYRYLKYINNNEKNNNYINTKKY